jgi:hypothetical protein
MTDKNNSEIVIHLPIDKQRQFKRLAERAGISSSEFGRQLIDDYLEQEKRNFEYMKTVFGSE